jgi:beta-mannosidase
MTTTRATPAVFSTSSIRLHSRSTIADSASRSPNTGNRRPRFHGLATLTELWLDDMKRSDSESMFVAHEDVELNGSATLAPCFRSLTPALAAKHSRALTRVPRAATDAAQRARHAAQLHTGSRPSIHAIGP